MGGLIFTAQCHQQEDLYDESIVDVDVNALISIRLHEKTSLVSNRSRETYSVQLSMNLTNESGKSYNEKNSSSDDEEDEENHPTFDNPPSIRIENFFSDHEQDEIDTSDGDDDDGDDDASDIENHYYSKSQLPTQNRLSSILRQSNRLVELKLNICENRLISTQQQSLRHALSDSDMSKRSYHYQNHPQQAILLGSLSSNNFHLSTTRSHRLYLPSAFLYGIQTQITSWLQASTCLIDSIVTSTFHRRCWPQLLLTHFIEQGLISLEFIRCSHSISLTTMNDETCSIHKHGCVMEDEAYKLCSILQRGSKFSLDASVFDHIRRIIVIKSMQEVINDNNHLQQIYVKQLKCLKQSLIHQQSSFIPTNTSTITVASIYSKLLLFLSSLYSIKSETMQTLFCQHLLHNPTYSYLLIS